MMIFQNGDSPPLAFMKFLFIYTVCWMSYNSLNQGDSCFGHFKAIFTLAKFQPIILFLSKSLCKRQMCILQGHPLRCQFGKDK